jgi:hypothetical protein
MKENQLILSRTAHVTDEADDELSSFCGSVGAN